MNNEHSNLQSTEARILQAAEKEFFEKGYAGARTVSIAEAAGVTHAMLHYYFRTKDKLFEQIVAGKINMLGDISSVPSATATCHWKKGYAKGWNGTSISSRPTATCPGS